MNEQINIKEEMIEEEYNEIKTEEPTLGPAALGLQRVGTPAITKQSVAVTPKPVLNARGMPARIRKKNKLFYDDDIVNTPHHRTPKKPKITPTKKPKMILTPNKHSRDIQKATPKKTKEKPMSPLPLQSPDRKIGQKIGLRLRNLLKLPKAHKWVCYEWFYSDIDKCLFSGENDFSMCLKESFPQLNTRELTRVEWTKIRRLMGKPRRCSQAFFNEERLELEKKRKKIRALQQRKATDRTNFKDLPEEIPMQLTIGTKVTARLRKPQDGLFTGIIEGVDTSNNTYRITFERQGLGTHSVPDYEVLSNESPETISVSAAFPQRARANGIRGYNAKVNTYFRTKMRGDPLLSGANITGPIMPGVKTTDSKIGGFPTKLLVKIVIVSKILNAKRTRVKHLGLMNTEAEKLSSYELEVTEEFEKRYAGILTDLETLNRDLHQYLDEIQQLCREIAPEPSVAAMLAPSRLREKCREDAKEMTMRFTSNPDKPASEARNLAAELIALLIQIKSFASSDQNAYELHVLQGTIEQIKLKLSDQCRQIFEDSIEVQMKFIQNGLAHSHLEKLTSSSSSSSVTTS